MNCVVTNNSEASYEAIKYLLSLGHKKIAAISRRPTQSTTIQRLEGYQRAMQEASLSVREEYIQADESEIEGAFRCVIRLLVKSPEPPTAIFTTNNRVSLGALQALREFAIPCPERVSVIGFDDPDWSVVSTPGLTTIEQPTSEIGKRAVELLLRSIESSGEEVGVEPERVLLKSALHIRESTRTPGVVRTRVDEPISISVQENKASGGTPSKTAPSTAVTAPGGLVRGH